MKFFVLFWLIAGFFAETVMYLAYEDCKEHGIALYGGRGNTKIATKKSNPEVYYKRMEEMRRGLWVFPLVWLLFFLFIRYNKINKAVDTSLP